MDNILRTTAEDYSKYLMVDFKSKLEPFSKALDDMLSRLEEFQTMINFNKQEQGYAKEQILCILQNKEELLNLFAKIDATERLVLHIKNNLSVVEEELTKAEEKLCINDSKTKMVNIFTPLFKKSINEKKDPPTKPDKFKTEDYFL